MPYEKDSIAFNLEKAADRLVYLGWKITTRDPEGKRGDKEPPRIHLTNKGTKARYSFEGGKYKFSFYENGGAFGTRWVTVVDSNFIDAVIEQVACNLR
jgi:hypothetical protein